MTPSRRRPLALAIAAVAVAGLVAALVVVAWPGDSREASESGVRPASDASLPEQLIEQVYGRLIGGQYGRAWDLLHPAHQAIVSRARYISCAAQWPPSPKLAKFEILKVYDDPIDVPLVPERLSKAVTYRVTVGSGGESDSLTSTGHAVDVGGQWRWVLARPDIASFLDGECP